MRNMFIGIAAAALLAGCAGTDFVRPSTDDLKNGQTTYAQVIARMGQPRTVGTVLKNEKTVKTATYAYASVGGQPLRPGVTPARAQSFYFFNDALVGHEFISSWAADNTDFDEGRIKDIAKGRTTRDQVAQLMGRPAGAYIHPMIKPEKGDAAVYLYAETTGSAFNLKYFRKLLIVTFDASGVVADVEYSSSGARQ
jgi:outer membrane protein assembly factor BamE (lipoprotein component of BamABCDE complex)